MVQVDSITSDQYNYNIIGDYGQAKDLAYWNTNVRTNEIFRDIFLCLAIYYLEHDKTKTSYEIFTFLK